MARQASDGQLGAWMRERRERAGLSQKDVAEIMFGERQGEARRQDVLRWEKGRVTPSTELLWLYMQAVGIEFTEKPPSEIPRPLNEEVRQLRQAVEELADGEAAQAAEIEKLAGELALLRRQPPSARAEGGNGS